MDHDSTIQSQPVEIFRNEALQLLRTVKRVRAFLAGRPIVDSNRVLLLREQGHTPVYYFPGSDVDQQCLEPSEHTTHCPRKGQTRCWSLRVGATRRENAAWQYPEPLGQAPDLSQHIAFYWNAMDAWFEEDEEVFVHPRDPFTRIDILPSSRRVQVILGGETVADTYRTSLLLETNLPPRYYLPKTDVRMELLAPSETVTACPYKGEARYYHLVIGDERYPDIAWYYPYPTREAASIANLVCLYQERVDALKVSDG